MNGLYLKEPHGSLIYLGKKTAIVKNKPWPEMAGRFIVCSGGTDGYAYGEVETAQEGPIDAAEFRARFPEHRVTDKERGRWWSDSNEFYIYSIKSFEPYITPAPVSIPPGVQTLMGEIKCEGKKMPKPKPDESRDDYLERCIPVLIEEGKEQDQAVAQCGSMWDQSQKHILLDFEEGGKGEVPLVPFGVTSLAEMETIEAARAKGVDVARKRAIARQIFDNIIEDEGVVNKKEAVMKLMSELEPEDESEDESEDEPENEDMEKACDDEDEKETTNHHDNILVSHDAKRKSFGDQVRHLWSQFKELFTPEPIYHVKVVERDGESYLVTYTTNAFIDRDGEIFTTQSINDYVDRHRDDEVKGETWYRHVPGSKFGEIVAQGVAGRVLVELTRFDDTPIGNAFKAAFQKYPDGHPEVSPEGWGCSHGYFYDPEDRKDKIYEWFDKRETSVLPLSVAANPWTKMEVKMDKSREEFVKLVGDEITDQIEANGRELTKELEGRVAFKEAGEPEAPAPEPAPVETPEPAPVEVEVPVEEEAAKPPEPAEVKATVDTETLVEAIKTSFDFDALGQFVTDIKATVAELKDENAALKAQVKELQRDDEVRLAEKEAERARWPWSADFRPSRESATEVKDGDPILTQKPIVAPSAIANLSKSMAKQ